MSLIKKPNQIQSVKNIKVLIYGQPGIGKTTIGLSAPQPLLFDFDGGVHRVKTQHLKDVVQIESWENMIDTLKEDLSDYQTIVFDTVGKMLDYMSAFIIRKEPKLGRKDGALTMQGYGSRKFMFISMLKQISIMGKHIVFISHDKEEKDGDQKIIRPDIGGSSLNDLIKELDLVGYVEASGKLRTISFDPCEKFYGKNTCDFDSLITLPDVTKSPNDFLTVSFNSFKISMDKRVEISESYSDLMEDITYRISQVVDALTADDFIEYIKASSHIWDSKIQASHALKITTDNLGLKFDPKAKVYV